MQKFRVQGDVLRALAVFVAASLVLWLLRAFVCQVYNVESAHPAVPFLYGDRVVVTKTDYGMRLPSCVPGQCCRLGSGSPQRGDMIAFNIPSSPGFLGGNVTLARCMALPGDTVYIDAKYGVSLRKTAGACPFAVPAKDTPVEVTRWNARLLCNAMNMHEPCHYAETAGDTLMLDGHPVRYVVFSQDYYWAYSGKQSNRGDSRCYGFVPMNHIIGKARFVAWSVEPGAPIRHCLRRGRFFMNLKTAGK